MTNVVRVRPEADLADADARERLLWEALAVLTDEALAHREREAELLARLSEVEARLPRRRFTVPPGWLGAQQAAYASGMSLAGFYRKWRRLGVIGVKFDRCFMFDPGSLPVRKL
jgi:hypothetical protein